MKFTYRLLASQNLNQPAFFNVPPSGSSLLVGSLDSHQLRKAVEQLTVRTDVIVSTVDDPIAISSLIVELTLGPPDY